MFSYRTGERAALRKMSIKRHYLSHCKWPQSSECCPIQTKLNAVKRFRLKKHKVLPFTFLAGCSSADRQGFWKKCSASVVECWVNFQSGATWCHTVVISGLDWAGLINAASPTAQSTNPLWSDLASSSRAPPCLRQKQAVPSVCAAVVAENVS